MAKLRPCIAEFIGTFALIFVGIGAIRTAGHDVLAVALAHGLTIAAFVSATMHISGGQLNPAVTFGLVCGGHMTLADAVRYWISQLLGATAAALICLGIFGRDVVVSGTPQLGTGISPGGGILVEAILTFFLVFVVHGTGIDERGRRVAGLAIGSTCDPRHSVRRPAHRRGDESRACLRPSDRGQLLERRTTYIGSGRSSVAQRLALSIASSSRRTRRSATQQRGRSCAGRCLARGSRPRLREVLRRLRGSGYTRSVGGFTKSQC
jgi:hypothetical protein